MQLESTTTGAVHPGEYNIALERHYSVQEVADMWNVSANTVRRTFSSEPGVIEFGSDETRWSRKRKIMRIPHSVLVRVHQQQRTVN